MSRSLVSSRNTADIQYLRWMTEEGDGCTGSTGTSATAGINMMRSNEVQH
jgi:hypothetical protein